MKKIWIFVSCLALVQIVTFLYLFVQQDEFRRFNSSAFKFLFERVQQLDLKGKSEEEAIFTPSSKGYIYLKANVGNFVVLLGKLVKYANGYKATFSIGNPSLVTYSGITVVLRWGKAIAPEQNFFDWEKTLKTQEISITKSLLPGIWNKVDLVLSPAVEEETGFIGLSLKANSILLNKDWRKTEG